MKHLRYPITITLLLLALLTGRVAPAAPTADNAGAPPPTAATTGFPVTITHDRGAITLDQPAERIVVFSEEFIELFVALDLAPVGVGGVRCESW